MRRILNSPRLRYKQRRKRAQKALLFFLLFFFLAGGGAYTLFLPLFSVNSISIAGDSALPKQAVSEFLKKELSGKYFGFIPKSNIILYPKRGLESALLSEFPLLATAKISRHLAALAVSLNDRKPAAIWCRADECFFMDESGFLFSSVPEDLGRLFYRFESEEATSSSFGIGDRALNEKRLGSIIEFLSRLEILNLGPRIVRFKARDELAVILQNGVQLLLEDDGDFAPELGRFDALLSEKDLIPRTNSNGLNIDYIDLRHGNKIYFKPK